jgi:hypothetical protein
VKDDNDDAYDAVSRIDLSSTEFVIDPSHPLSVWNTFSNSGNEASSSQDKGVVPAKEWPHWHSITITATSAKDGSCSIRSPLRVGDKDMNDKESLAMAAMSAWNGGYFIPIVRFLRLGDTSNTVSTARSLHSLIPRSILRLIRMVLMMIQSRMNH